MTGFTRKTRSLVIKRDRALCQWCGDAVTGDYSLQHRRARGMGGSKNPITSSAANAVLVHGTGTTECHGYIEQHPDEALERGFRVRQGSDPRFIPIVTWSGVDVWLDEAGERHAAHVGVPEDERTR